MAGTTGDDALTPADLRLLPDAYTWRRSPPGTSACSPNRAPARAAPASRASAADYPFAGGSTVTVLGDGRSLNLFEADAIPNEGYDAYRAGTLIAAAALCRQAGDLRPASTPASSTRSSPPRGCTRPTTTPTSPPRTRAAEPGSARRDQRPASSATGSPAGCTPSSSPPTARRSPSSTPSTRTCPGHTRPSAGRSPNCPDAVASAIALWSVCCPTADHLPVLRSILTRNPAARVLLEKPACQGHEISELASLLAAHPAARVLITDQYQHSTVAARARRPHRRHGTRPAL